MRRSLKATILIIVGLILFGLLVPRAAQAQSTSPPDFSFDNFAGTYYLDRNSKGVATLTVQEDMTVVFPLNGNFYGIKRAIPEKYQGHDLNLKVISVTDAGGVPVNYQISDDKQGDKVLVTGDKDITLSGIQTYSIKYQTSGVAAINANSDQFLVDVNGRGWQETFDSVKAFVHIAKSFTPSLVGKPSCYIGTAAGNLDTCSVQTVNQSDGELVTATTTTKLTAHQALVVNLNFKKGTFSQKKPASKVGVIIEICLAVLFFIGGVGMLMEFFRLRRLKPNTT